MEKVESTHQKLEKLPQKSNKKKSVKVVYISNPVKIKATPSEFRAVVQQFTGKYAATSSPPPYDHDLLKPTAKKVYNDAQKEQQRQIQKWLDDHNTSTDTQYSVNEADIYNYESSCGNEQVIEDMIHTPQIYECFPSLLASDFGSSRD